MHVFVLLICIYIECQVGLQVKRSCASLGPEPMGMVAWMDVKLSLRGRQSRRLTSSLICPQHLKCNTFRQLGALISIMYCN